MQSVDSLEVRREEAGGVVCSLRSRGVTATVLNKITDVWPTTHCCLKAVTIVPLR